MATIDIKTYTEVRVHDLTSLRARAEKVEGNEFLLAGQWFTEEMIQFLPNDNCIRVEAELDYFVWSVNGEQFRIQADWVDGLGTVQAPEDPNTVINPWSGTGSVSSSPTAEASQAYVSPFENFQKVYKKKPKSTNKFPIEKGDLVLINGLAIPQIVTAIINDGDGYKVEVAGSITALDSKQVFPMYPLDMSGSTPSIEIGDLVETQRFGFVLPTNGDELEVTKANGGQYKIYRHTDPDNKLIPRGKLKRYSTGEIIDAKTGEKLKDTALGKVLEARFKPNIEEVVGSFEIEVIAKHYGIKAEDVKPKEVKILKTLEVLLDHPDCIKDKEWALIVGPSGSGKTTVAVEYAESKGLEYIIQGGSAQLTVDDLLGYNSITTGDYFPSLLRDAIENGKVFILDEIDSCNPNSLLCLNAFKRDEVQFPDKLIKVHPEFRFIATANTLMYSEDYNGRSAMDRATIKRFSLLFYDLTKAELAVRYGFEETKDLVSNVTDKKAYSTSEYKLVHDCILEPTGDYDPRDIQRLVRSRRLEKEGAFNF